MRGWRVLAAGVVCVLLVGSGAAPVAAATPVTPPASPWGAQVAWLLDVSHRLPASEEEVTAHIDPAVLAQVGVAVFNQAMAAVSGASGLALLRYAEAPPGSGRFLATSDTGTWLAALAVQPAGLIVGLNLAPYAPAPTSWAQVDQRLRALAPRVSLLAARVDEAGCRPVHGVAADNPRPLGSAFKLYVLGALAHEVAAGRAAWDEPLAIRDAWKSLPSGQFQDLPAGTALPLRQYANAMIAISDNTATDHLIQHLGRVTVTAQQPRFGLRRPNLPFLTTRELFQLKLEHYPTLLDLYRRLPPPARTAFVAAVVDRLPLPAVEDAASWTGPRGIDAVEWFASPADICRAFAGLDRQSATPGLEPVGAALSLNDGGIWLDPDGWSTTWFKGGSEPGVLTLNYLARTTDGRTYVVSAMLSDPAAPLVEATVVFELQSLIRGAFALSAGIPALAVAGAARPDATVPGPLGSFTGRPV